MSRNERFAASASLGAQCRDGKGPAGQDGVFDQVRPGGFGQGGEVRLVTWCKVLGASPPRVIETILRQ